MYLDNPKKLFKDLKNIDTLYGYMVAVEEDGQQDDLSDLISIVEDHIDKMDSGDSLIWDDTDMNEIDKIQLKEDKKTLRKIYRKIQKEQENLVRCPYCGSYEIKTATIYSENYGYIGYATCQNCKATAKTSSDDPRDCNDYCANTRREARKNALKIFRLGHIEKDTKFHDFISVNKVIEHE